MAHRNDSNGQKKLKVKTKNYKSDVSFQINNQTCIIYQLSPADLYQLIYVFI